MKDTKIQDAYILMGLACCRANAVPASAMNSMHTDTQSALLFQRATYSTSSPYLFMRAVLFMNKCKHWVENQWAKLAIPHELQHYVAGLLVGATNPVFSITFIDFDTVESGCQCHLQFQCDLTPDQYKFIASYPTFLSHGDLHGYQSVDYTDEISLKRVYQKSALTSE